MAVGSPWSKTWTFFESESHESNIVMRWFSRPALTTLVFVSGHRTHKSRAYMGSLQAHES